MTNASNSFERIVSQAQPSVVDPSAIVTGTVSVGAQCSIWPYAVSRAGIEHVDIGERTNVQDFVMIHVGLGSGSVVARHAIVTEGEEFPPGSITAGMRAMQIGLRGSVAANRVNALTYWHMAQARATGRDVLQAQVRATIKPSLKGEL